MERPALQAEDLCQILLLLLVVPQPMRGLRLSGGSKGQARMALETGKAFGNPPRPVTFAQK